MVTLLLIVIYIAFIGLGIPDSLFGAVWPAIYGEFALPVSYANFITVISSICTFVSSLLSGRVINRFGVDKVTAVSTGVTAVALFGMSFSDSFIFLILLSVPLGLGAGAIDSGLNNYVALHYNAMQMNFLHCFYGVGVSLSPFLLSFALSGENGWRGGYRWVAFIQVVIFAIVFVSIPLWKKVEKKSALSDEDEKPVTLSLGKLLKVKGLPAVWLMFFGSCAIEASCGIWGSTFLVEHKGMSVDSAAAMTALYYLGITVGRFMSGLLSVKLSSKKLIVIGQTIVAAALVTLALPLSSSVAGVGLFLAGLGISPVYPNLMHLTPKFFGRGISASVMGTQMAAACLGIMLAPTGFGIIAEHIGVGAFPYYMAVMFVIMIAATALSKIRDREEK